MSCIPSNPDIAGIGVRISIYVQNFLGLFNAIVYAADGEISLGERRAVASTSSAILLTGCAVLISATIQAKTFGLSAYHAIIILNLSWMNNTHFLIFMIITFGEANVAFVFGSLEASKQISAPFNEGRNSSQTSLPNPPNFSKKPPLPEEHPLVKAWEGCDRKTVVWVGLLHLSYMGIMGIWFWSTISTFGDSTECTPFLETVIFGQNVPVTSSRLRRASLAIFGITATPFVNVYILTLALAFALLGLELALIPPILALSILFLLGILLYYLFKLVSLQSLPSSTSDKPTKHDRSKSDKDIRSRLFRRVAYYTPLLGVLIIDIIFTIDTELMIHRSKALVQAGESQWTFGQTLALAVTLVPVFELGKRWFRWLERKVLTRAVYTV